MADRAGKSAGSVARVRAALLAAGHADTIRPAPAGARTAEEAAAAVGCAVAQIVKSLVFRLGDAPLLALVSGANRVDPGRLAALFPGAEIGRADAGFVRAVTGFAIGGVAPIGHLTAPETVIDADLWALDPIFAAAGAPDYLFQTSAAALVRLTGGRVVALRAEAL
jgi:prolyl-tRNA editing enzyme YbaK/EbsC (Cys-tRNA(Pro) deacylase)